MPVTNPKILQALIQKLLAPTSDTIPGPALKPQNKIGKLDEELNEIVGPGPDDLTSASGTKFDVQEEGVRGKYSTDFLENATRDIFEENPTISLEDATKEAEKRLEKHFESFPGRKSYQGQTVRERAKNQAGRKAAIKRGDQKYMPRGNYPKQSTPLSVFGEEDLGVTATREALQEAEGPRSRVVKQSKKKEFGSMEQEGAKEQLDDLFGKETDRIVGEISDELGLDPVLRTASPSIQKDLVEDLFVPSAVRYKNIDQTSKKIFSQLKELEDALKGIETKGLDLDFSFDTSPGKGILKEADIGSRPAKVARFNFKRIASRVVEAARLANTPGVDEARVIKVINKLPEELKETLRGQMREGTSLPEALEDLVENLLDRLNKGLYQSILQGGRINTVESPFASRVDETRPSRSMGELSRQRLIDAQQSPESSRFVGLGGLPERRRPLTKTFETTRPKPLDPKALDVPLGGSDEENMTTILIDILRDHLLQKGNLGPIDAPTPSTAVSTKLGPIPAPRSTVYKDNVMSKVQRGVSDREADGFSMTENQFDQLNIQGEIDADAARFAGQPIQNKHIPGSLDADDAALDMVMGVQMWQDGKIFIINSPDQFVHVNDLTDNSLRKIIQDPNTKDIVIAPNDIERLP